MMAASSLFRKTPGARYSMSWASHRDNTMIAHTSLSIDGGVY